MVVGTASDVKACLGAAFIHYVAYWVFYSIDAIKLAASDDPKQQNNNSNPAARAKGPENAKRNDPRDASQTNALSGKPNPPGYVGEHPVPGTRPSPFGTKPAGIDGDDAKPGVDMKDIDLGIPGHPEEKKQPAGLGSGPLPPKEKPKKPEENEDEHAEDLDGYDNEGAPFFSQVVSRYPKSIIWYFMVLAFIAERASTPFGIVICYLSLISRGVQIVGVFLNKPIISYVGYVLSLLLLIMMFGNAMIYEAD